MKLISLEIRGNYNLPYLSQVIIFFGVVMFSVLCCCMKGWVAKAKAGSGSDSKKGLLRPGEPGVGPGGPGGVAPIYGPASVMEDGGGGGGGGPGGAPISPTPAGGTDNPLWIDQKFKAYEEQELTMTVFSDQDNSVISGAGNSSSGNGQQGEIIA